jgi:acetylornithine deacetylase/succinyl-diaminopimelate desuccinylase family protein
MVDLLRGAGITAELSWAAPGRPNVVARIAGARPGQTLLLNGHLDTVPAGEGWSVDPYGAVIRDGRIYGRGASDMKAGVVGMAYAAIQLHRLGNPFAGELVLLFNSDEERLNLGMIRFLADGGRADFAVIGEPSDLDVCSGHRGVARFWVTTRGVPGHTSFVKVPDNAISKMVRLLIGLEQLGDTVRARAHPFVGQGSLTVAEIHGGTAPNIVPALCRAHIDRRTLPGERREEIIGEVEQCLTAVASAHGCSYELDCYQFIPATHLDHAHPLVEAMEASARAVRGAAVRIKAFEATCEAPFFAVDRGIPTLVFGPGGIRHAHTVDEHVELSEFLDAAKIYADLVMRLLPLLPLR